MKNLRWAVAGALIGIALGLVGFAPAKWLAGGLAWASGSRVQLLDARGTVWRGDAQLLLSGGAGSNDAQALPGRLQWEIDPAWRGVELRLRAGCCTPQPLQLLLQPVWGGARLRVADGNSQWPAAVLAGLGAPWNTLQPQGSLRLRSEGLSVEWIEGRMQLGGTANLEALGMSSSLSTLRPLGSYNLRLVGGTSQSTPLLQLQTLEGALILTGNGQWTGSHWKFQGEASAAPEAESALGNLLNMVGRRDGARSVITLG